MSRARVRAINLINTTIVMKMGQILKLDMYEVVIIS